MATSVKSHFCVALFVLCWAASLSLAHEFRPGHLRLIEVEETAARFHVVWKKPMLTNTNIELAPIFSEVCDLTEVKPGERASLHSHFIRHELFHFLDDGGVLEIDGDLFYPKAHEEFLIKPGQKHRFWAEESNFRMLVVSLGEWKAEDQIRHEDDYGRQGEPLKL